MRFVRIDTSHLVARHHPSRRARVLPLLLLVLIVCTLVLIALSHIAVIHRANLSQQMASFPNSMSQAVASSNLGSPNSNSGYYRYHHQQHRPSTVGSSTGHTSTSKAVTNANPFKLEPLLSRNVTSIERNALLLKNYINEMRVVAILQNARKNRIHVEYHNLNEMTTAANPSHNHSNSQKKTVQTKDTYVEEGETKTFPTDVPTENYFAEQNVTHRTNVTHLSSKKCSMFEPNLLPYCPKVPPYLVGQMFATNHSHNATMEEVMEDNADVCPGGWWMPNNCTSHHRVAIIIPYRDREEHLSVLLSHLHPILQRQQLNYRIYVAEQFGNGTFNKGSLMNAAFVEALKEGNYHCFVFHDVDLIPENDRNMYSCPDQPRHMSVAVDEFQYKLPYSALVGGVFSIMGEHFMKVNGYSNMYWGWGGEDDDMSSRIFQSGLNIVRPSSDIARYRMIKHRKRKPLIWKIRGKLLGTARKRMRFDGLNTLNYTIVGKFDYPLYTNLSIDVGKCPFTSDLS